LPPKGNRKYYDINERYRILELSKRMNNDDIILVTIDPEFPEKVSMSANGIYIKNRDAIRLLFCKK
jgi:hypothetical protein